MYLLLIHVLAVYAFGKLFIVLLVARAVHGVGSSLITIAGITIVLSMAMTIIRRVGHYRRLSPHKPDKTHFVHEHDCALKGALYRIWCGVNRLGDSGVKVV